MGNGWYSYNHKGVHFVGLNNCVQVDAMGNMGNDQLAWLKSDLAGLAGLSHSTPIVVFAHIPLWMVYEKWGWGTKDGEQALAMLKPFGSVTVLNGHNHQVVQKVEGIARTSEFTMWPHEWRARQSCYGRNGEGGHGVADAGCFAEALPRCSRIRLVEYARHLNSVQGGHRG